MIFSNKTYDAVKTFAQIHLPALGTLYFALSAIWGLPHPEQVIGTIAAIDTFLGIGLSVSNASYTAPTDGSLVVDKSDPIKDVYSLEVTTPVHEIDAKKTITLNVTKTGNDQLRPLPPV
jgi:hypothetical protein